MKVSDFQHNVPEITDFRNFFADLERQSIAVGSLLETSTNELEILKSAVSFLTVLCLKLPLDDYLQVFAICLSYLAEVRKTFMKMEKDKIQAAFEMVSCCNLVLPRLYVSFTLAYVLNNEEILRDVIEMFPAVADPLHGFLARFAAISLFPKESRLLGSFAFSNFSAMFDMIPGFLEEFPHGLTAMVEWLTTNIVISLFACKSNSEVVWGFMNSAKKCSNRHLSIKIVESIACAIDPELMESHFQMFIDYIRNNPKGTEEIALQCISFFPDSPRVVDFIKKIPYKDAIMPKIGQIGLKKKGVALVNFCMETCKSDIEKKLLAVFGIAKLPDVSHNLSKDSPIIYDYLNRVTSDIPADRVRMVLRNEMISRNPEIDLCLREMIIRNRYDVSVLECLFAEPFVIVNADLLKLVVFRLLAGKSRSISSIIARAKVGSTDITTLLCHTSPASSGNALVEKVCAMKSPEAISILLRHIGRFDISESVLRKLFNAEMHPEDIRSMVCIANAKGFVDLVKTLVLELLKKDTACDGFESLVDFHVRNLILIRWLNSASRLIDETVVKSVTDLVLQIIEDNRYSMFPIASEEVMHTWAKTLNLLLN